MTGDPSGIGPEVAAKLLAEPQTRERAEIVAIGDAAPACPPAQASRIAGEYTIRTLRAGIAALQSRAIDALVYAPLNKQSMKLAGLTHPDELHFFAVVPDTPDRCRRSTSAAACGRRALLHTRLLREVAGLLTVEKIRDACRLLHRTIAKSGIAAPRIAVAA